MVVMHTLPCLKINPIKNVVTLFHKKLKPMYVRSFIGLFEKNPIGTLKILINSLQFLNGFLTYYYFQVFSAIQFLIAKDDYNLN